MKLPVLRSRTVWGLVALGAAISLLGARVPGDLGLFLALGGFAIWFAGVTLQFVGFFTTLSRRDRV